MKCKLVLALCTVILLLIAGCDGALDTSQNNAAQIETAATEPPDISSSNPSEAADARQEGITPVLESQTDSEASDLQQQDGDVDNSMIDITITVNGADIEATLYNNEATQALIGIFPMTLDMSDLHRNEKYYYLSENLPTNSERVGSIRTGDIMLYGANCLVLFYEDFNTSYSYTRLGYINDVSGLADALGQGNVQVAFAVSE